MPEVLRTPLAEQDLADAWWYLAERNPTSADKLLRMLARTFDLIAEHPGLGRRRPDLSPELMSFPIVRTSSSTVPSRAASKWSAFFTARAMLAGLSPTADRPT